MRFHQKTTTWLKEFAQLFTGAAVMMMHKEPPEHYLGYTIKGKVPIILVPGILGKWGYMKDLGDKLSLLGHPVYIVPELGYNIYSIPSSARKLRALIMHAIPSLGHTVPKVSKGAKVIQKFIKKKNIKGAVIIAHSKGGLIGKYFLAHFKGIMGCWEWLRWQHHFRVLH